MCLTLPEVLVSRGRHREGGADLAGPRRVPAAAAAVLDRRADEPLHLDLVRGARPATARRRCTSCCSTTAAPAALADEVGRQALRCIRCSACLNVCPVYERTGGHAYGSVYPGPIGAILNPLLQGGRRRRADRLAALRLHAVRCLLRGLPGRASTSRRCWSHLRAQVVDAHRGGRCPSPEALAMRAAAWVLGDAAARRWPSAPPGCPAGSARPSAVELPGGRRRSAGCRGPAPRGPTPATCRRRPASRSGPGGGARTAAATRRERPRRDPRPGTRGAGDGAEPAPSARCRPRGRAPTTGPVPTLVDLFVERVADYRATVVAVRGPTRSRAAVAAALSGAGSVVVPDGPAGGLPPVTAGGRRVRTPS